MKKKNIILTLAAMLTCGGAVCLSGCSKDGSENILGSWQRVAFYWAYSGCPDESYNYSSGGTMNELDGASNMKFVFNDDNTGMIIDEWFSDPDNNGIDTIYFTYSIDGNGGVITTMATESTKATWTTTYAIQDIEDRSMVVYEKTVAENFQHYVGYTSPYTRVEERWHHCKKIQ